MTSQVVFRLATRADEEALISLKHEINLAEHAVYPSKTAIPALLDLSRSAAAAGVKDYWTWIEANGGAYLVGELDGKVVCGGCWYGETAAVSTLPDCQRQAGIGGIVVLPEARGLGLGRLIMRELETLIRAQGIKHVRLTVVPGNGPAESLYHNLGFEDFEMLMIKTLS
jgi:ribosomal protein S18 acetylase RimI-like enzyme